MAKIIECVLCGVPIFIVTVYFVAGCISRYLIFVLLFAFLLLCAIIYLPLLLFGGSEGEARDRSFSSLNASFMNSIVESRK